MKFTPACSMRTRAWPRAGTGSGTVSSFSSSGPPVRWTRIARMGSGGRPRPRPTVRALVHPLGEVGPADALLLLVLAPAPVDRATADLEVAELLALGVDLEVERRPGLGDPEHLEVQVHRMLPLHTRAPHAALLRTGHGSLRLGGRGALTLVMDRPAGPRRAGKEAPPAPQREPVDASEPPRDVTPASGAGSIGRRRKDDAEGAPPAGLALRLDAASQQFADRAGDAEPEPGAAVSATRRVVRLLERSKHDREPVRRDPDPGVHD